jgi:hypothetical protein
VQLEDIKSQHREENPFLKPTLRLAQMILIDGTAPISDSGGEF